MSVMEVNKHLYCAAFYFMGGQSISKLTLLDFDYLPVWEELCLAWGHMLTTRPLSSVQDPGLTRAQPQYGI